MRPVVAIDLGGTSIRAAFYPQGAPPATTRQTRKTPSYSGPSAVLEAIHDTIAALDLPTASRASLAIGIGAPGPLDPVTGVVLDAPNLPGWENIALVAALGERWGCPVFVHNDANLATLGEWRYGAGHGAHNLVMLTIGTGVGGGAIVDDRLLTGGRGLAGELGHIPIQLGGPLCSCGQRGHLEAIASGTAIAREYRSRLGREADPAASADDRFLTAEVVAERAASGDPLAAAVLDDAADALGTALAGMVHTFNPERIILGGGVAQSGPGFLNRIEATLRARLMHPAFGDGLSVLASALRDEAALLGAVVLVQNAA